MRTVPVNQSAGPLLEGCEPLLLIYIFANPMACSAARLLTGPLEFHWQPVDPEHGVRGRRRVDCIGRMVIRPSNRELRVNRWRRMADVPARTTASDAMSRDLLKRGFKFAGATISYALVQATGMVNDHLVTCPRTRNSAAGIGASNRTRN